jgi:hypothetical protein
MATPHFLITWIDPLTTAPPRILRGSRGSGSGAIVKLDGPHSPRVRLALSAVTREVRVLDTVAAVDFHHGYAWIGSSGWIDWRDSLAVEGALEDTAIQAAEYAGATRPPLSMARSGAAELLTLLESAESDKLGGLAKFKGASSSTLLLSPARIAAVNRLAQAGLAVDCASDDMSARLRLLYPLADALTTLSSLLAGAALGRDAAAVEPRRRAHASSTFGALGAAAAPSLASRAFCETGENGSWLAFSPATASRAPLSALARRLSFLTLHALTVSGPHKSDFSGAQPTPLRPPPSTPATFLKLVASITPHTPNDEGDDPRRKEARLAAHWQRMTSIIVSLRVLLALEWTHSRPDDIKLLGGGAVAGSERAQPAMACYSGEIVRSRGTPSVLILHPRASPTDAAPALAPLPSVTGPSPQVASLFIKGGSLPNVDPAIFFPGLSSWYRSVPPLNASPQAKRWRAHVQSLIDFLRPTSAPL